MSRAAGRVEVAALPQLGQRGEVRLVVQAQVEGAGQRGPGPQLVEHRDVAPAEVGRHAELAAPGLHQAWDGDGDAGHPPGEARTARAPPASARARRRTAATRSKATATAQAAQVAADRLAGPHRAGEVDRAGADVVDVDLDADAHRAVRVEADARPGPAGAREPGRHRGPELGQSPASSRVSTRLDDLALVSPVAAAIRARDAGPESATWPSDAARGCARAAPADGPAVRGPAGGRRGGAPAADGHAWSIFVDVRATSSRSAGRHRHRPTDERTDVRASCTNPARRCRRRPA